MSWPNHQTHVHMALWLYFLSLENRLLLTESHKGAAHWALTVSICMSLASMPYAIHHHLCKQPAIPFALTTIFLPGYPIISCLLGRVFLFATQNLFHWPASTRCHLRVCEKCSLLSLALHLWNQDSCFIRSPQVLTRWSGEELQLYLAELLHCLQLWGVLCPPSTLCNSVSFSLKYSLAHLVGPLHTEAEHHDQRAGNEPRPTRYGKS